VRLIDAKIKELNDWRGRRSRAFERSSKRPIPTSSRRK
jgi:hypothetical protein